MDYPGVSVKIPNHNYSVFGVMHLCHRDAFFL